jgi:hypothetical protein
LEGYLTPPTPSILIPPNLGNLEEEVRGWFHLFKIIIIKLSILSL